MFQNWLFDAENYKTKYWLEFENLLWNTNNKEIVIRWNIKILLSSNIYSKLNLPEPVERVVNQVEDASKLTYG